VRTEQKKFKRALKHKGRSLKSKSKMSSIIISLGMSLYLYSIVLRGYAPYFYGSILLRSV
jgi:hypothetical protein